VAAAGYGKTTALRAWYGGDDVQWYRGAPLTLTGATTAAIDAGARTVVIDDAPDLAAADVRALADLLAERTDPLTIVVASRWPTPTSVPLGWTETGPGDLALRRDQVAAILLDEYGIADADVTDRVCEATAGWPALVHLVAETLRVNGVPAGPLAPAVAEPGGPLAEYLRAEVLAALPADALRLLRLVGDLVPVTAGLCGALNQRQATASVTLLRRLGLLARSGCASAVPGGPAPVDRVVPVVAEVVRQGQRRPSASRTAATLAAAARWYEDNGHPLAAGLAHKRVGDVAGWTRVLERHGDRMLSQGQAEPVADLMRGLPAEHLTRPLRLLLGDALRTAGDLTAAARAYESARPNGSTMDAGLAWRAGRIAYQRGDALGALETFGRGRNSTDADGALLLAWTAHAHLLAGDVETACRYAHRAVDAALRATELGTGGDIALATAYLSVALCLGVRGDAAGSEEHFGLAQPIAERAGDLLLLARIFTNRTHHLLISARYGEALEMARRSARYADAAGAPSLRAIASSNEAEALAMLGRYDEAVAGYEAALAHYQRKGSRRFAAALLGLGELYRRRGWREQARAAYEEAVRVTEDTGNVHVLVPALAGLALVVLDEDPKAAAAHAEQAVALASDEIIVPALVAQGWVALRADTGGAAELAVEAARLARTHRARAGLADTLELRAATETDPARGREALREAQAIWASAGAELEAARLQVMLAGSPAATTEERLDGLLAAERLAKAGAVVDRTAPIDQGPNGRAEVSVRALGRFEVLVGGRPVPPSDWQSRKARDLLRILVARRGRPVPRGELCELLWPDDDADRTGHRLSVLLSIVRGVLDPAKAFEADRFIVADQASVALDVTRVRVDVEDFLAQVAHGRRLVERGAVDEGRTMLMAADADYRADVFEDEPYSDWSTPLREEARAAYLSMLRTLAHVCRIERPTAAVGYLLRLLERDPYDEPGHRAVVRALVAAGHHGEARRAFDRYRDAMRQIGVRPPDEAILLPSRSP
jgi:DNA-binding SARP family transcriptional activator/ATP/maltotriose-dependent transcriptional regulator MalT